MNTFFKKTYHQPLAKFAVLALSLTLTVSSCKKDFLVAKPELSLIDEEAFTSPERILAQVNGLYATAKSGALFGGRYLIYNDIRAEEFRVREFNSNTGATVHNATVQSSDTNLGNIWTAGYLVINRVNYFLEGLEKNKKVLSEALYDNYKAEARFLRAYAYFGLVQIFAKPYVLNNGASRGLPIRLKAELTAENNTLKSSTVAQVYAQILDDLNEAEKSLPNTYGSALLRTTRAHKNTAIAVKTRVYLAMGNYAKVLEEGNKIVPQAAPFENAQRAPHALQANIASVFVAPFTTSESIFSLPMDATNPPGTQNQLGFYFNAGNGNLEYVINTTGFGIYSDPAWPAADARRTAFIQQYSASIGWFTKKFSGTAPFVDFVPQIRYAEVLLNVAEAEALIAGGNLVRSRALLDAVRHRSDPNYDFGALATGAALEKAIMTERRIEFLAEGMRYNNLARKAEPMLSIGAGSLIQVADPRYTLPLPDVETYYNPAADW